MRFIDSLRDAVLARATLADTITTRVRQLFVTDDVEPDMPDREGLSGLPRAPLEQLESDATVSRDFRNYELWPRDATYTTARYGWPKNKKRGRSHGTIPWERITTIVIHTAGVNEPPRMRGNKPSGMHPDRWLGVPCHTAVANDGTIVLCHPLNAYLYAAHAANRYSCSLEIAGNQTITEYQVPAARAALRYMAAELRRHRPGPVKVIPHRFSHLSRVDDPGEEIWQLVGEWGQRELGLVIGDVVGSGRPLPW